MTRLPGALLPHGAVSQLTLSERPSVPALSTALSVGRMEVSQSWFEQRAVPWTVWVHILLNSPLDKELLWKEFIFSS